MTLAKSNKRREQSRDILSAKSSKTEKREGSAKSSEGSIKDMLSEGSEKRPESAKSKTSEGTIYSKIPGKLNHRYYILRTLDRKLEFFQWSHPLFGGRGVQLLY